MKRKTSKLTPYEQMLEDHFEETSSIKNAPEEMELFKKSAEQYLRKNKRITIRIYDKDLQRIKQMAGEEGLPYQTFITSVLHKVCTGRVANR